MTPAILVTITHGMGFPNGDARQITHQGALLCQDWPGPNEWMGQPMPGEFYFASDDVGEESQLCGLIAILQATYSAGTPKLLDYANPSGRRDQERTIIAPHDFLAALPKRLLGHPKGGALAVVGQVGLSWVEPAGRASVTSAPSVPSLEIRLMEGYPVGAALETGRQAHSDLAAVVAGSLLEGTLTENAAEMRLLRQLHNARTQIIIGDPAVRLPLCGPAKAPPGRLGA